MPSTTEVAEKAKRAFPPTSEETTLVQMWNAFFGSGDGNRILREEMNGALTRRDSRTWRLNQATTVAEFVEVISSLDKISEFVVWLGEQGRPRTSQSQNTRQGGTTFERAKEGRLEISPS